MKNGKVVSRAFRLRLAEDKINLAKILTVLKQENVNPVVVGGLAVQHHGYKRLTDDVDLLISRRDYDRLEQQRKIQYGQLKLVKWVQVDVLTEGKDNNPDPETVREPGTHFPTLVGLLLLKTKAFRGKDRMDVWELLKIHQFDPTIAFDVEAQFPPELLARFKTMWETAQQEEGIEVHWPVKGEKLAAYWAAAKKTWDAFPAAIRDATLDVLALAAHDEYVDNFWYMDFDEQIDRIEQDAPWLRTADTTHATIVTFFAKMSEQEAKDLASTMWVKKYAAVFDLDAAIEMLGFDGIVRYAERIARH